jgi:hypothetical protein
MNFNASTTASALQITFDASENASTWYNVDRLDYYASSSSVFLPASTTITWTPGLVGANYKQIKLPLIGSKYFRAVFTGTGDFGSLAASITKFNR